MVITLTNNEVIVYDVEEREFNENKNNLLLLKDKIIYACEKFKYSPSKMIIELNSKDYDVSKINYYYYDNGSEYVKKNIKEIMDIQYYTDDVGNYWPSEEYYYSKANSVSLDYTYADLIMLDNKLNSSDHLKILLSEKRVREFLKLYNSDIYINKRKEMFTQDVDVDLLNKFYEIDIRGKLLYPKNIKTLTASQLTGCIYLLCAKAGIDENNVMRYFVKEYTITAKDTKEISKIFNKMIKCDSIKSMQLTDDERYRYFDIAAMNCINTLYNSNTLLGAKEFQIVNEDTKTWENIEKDLMIKRGLKVEEELNDNWKVFSKNLIDARDVKKGNIVPLIIDYYISNQQEKKEDNKFIDSSVHIENKYIHDDLIEDVPIEILGDIKEPIKDIDLISTYDTLNYNLDENNIDIEQSRKDSELSIQHNSEIENLKNLKSALILFDEKGNPNFDKIEEKKI